MILLIIHRRVIPRAGARNRNKIFELSLQPSNHYCDVIERSTDGENIYDTINDNSIVYENQHTDSVSNNYLSYNCKVQDCYSIHMHALNCNLYIILTSSFCRRREPHCFYLYLPHQLTAIRGQFLMSYLTTHHPPCHTIITNHPKYWLLYHHLISLSGLYLLSLDLLHQSLLYYQNQEKGRRLKQWYTLMLKKVSAMHACIYAGIEHCKHNNNSSPILFCTANLNSYFVIL